MNSHSMKPGLQLTPVRLWNRYANDYLYGALCVAAFGMELMRE